MERFTVSRTAVTSAPSLPNPYTVRCVRFASGERMPLLVHRATGIPLQAPSYWTASDRRLLGLQANTLEQELRSLMFLYLWGDARGVDPVKRIRSPDFLTLAELNDLDRFCRQPLEEAIAAAHVRLAVACDASEPVRTRSSELAAPGHIVVRNRMASIHSFMDHVSFDHLSRLTPGTDAYRTYTTMRSGMLGRWVARYRSLNLPRSSTPREGLDRMALARLRDVIHPDHPDNPWRREVRCRNGLIVLALWTQGVRRGELLAMRTGDLEFGAERAFMTIVRRPDDPLDARSPKPSVKTLGRRLVIGPALADALRGYIMGPRRACPAARKHPFVFVSSTDGSPLSVSSANKVFQALRLRVPELPDDLSPHVMRHCWNDAFSEASDRANTHRTDVEKAQEVRMRSYLMGWVPNSSMAEHYSRRWLVEAANSQSLAMQHKQAIVTPPASAVENG